MRTISTSEYGRDIHDECRAAVPLAGRLRDSRASLTLRWLERIAARVSMPPAEMFPSQDLLDHVPLLIESIADYLESPREDGPNAERVMAKASELGQMRFEQGFSPYQILKEFEVLGGIVLSYLSRAADDTGVDCPPGEFMVCAQRVHRALALIQQATSARYLAMLETDASEREQRLRAMNEILSGPLGSRLDDALAAARELEATGSAEGSMQHDLRARLERVGEAVTQLRLLSEIRPSSRMQRNVPLNGAVAEAIRTLRESARVRDLAIRTPHPLPAIEVNAAAVELSLLVVLNTLIRHGEAVTDERSIEVLSSGDGSGPEAMVRLTVRDTGGRLPDAALAPLEGGAREDSLEDGPAVAVSLEVAREAIERLGGRITLHITDDPPATEFILELPARRAEDLT